ERYYNPDDVAEKVRSAITGLLSFNSVDFRQMLYLSDFYKAIEEISGIRYVMIYEFRTEQYPDGYATAKGKVPVKPDGKIEMGVNEIPIAGTITVNQIQSVR
ncbi:MAG TPA: hypothetical protein VF799_04945, partial [Geobacteraceae bacterium]